ncbi:MAG: tRNA 2-selenouridine(34) synthase MnmH [Desulfobulbaceae bacterium]|nr:tRNA 2-selenouridine(34) synthase MnmH [Desulfobulbaceae bacterium]
MFTFTPNNTEPDLIRFVDIHPGNHPQFIDVRSPSEYKTGHIPGAVNVPLFNDTERALVGTLYKRVSKEAAITKGFELAGPKRHQIVEAVKKIAGNEALIYCWRGGIRSGSVCRLLAEHGIQTKKIEGGYKAYRKHIRTSFQKPAHFIVLGGFTGSGKTAILHGLQRQNTQILDLEGLANHKGSVFGHINQPPQPTTEQFENNLYKKFQPLSKTEPIIIENESYAIGQVHLPEPFLLQMRSAPLISLDIAKEARIKRLVEEYGKSDRKELIAAAKQLEKKLGAKKMANVEEYLQHDRLDLACEVLLTHYDSYYNRSFGKREKEAVHVLQLTGTDLEKDVQSVARKIMELRF